MVSMMRGILITALALLAPFSACAETLAAGTALRLARGDLRIETAPGDYIAGRIEAGANPVDADLLAADGHHFRRIARSQSGTIPFRAVAEGPALILRLTAGAEVQVVLDQQIPVAAQIPPAPDYDSPRIAGLAAGLAQGETTDRFWSQVAAEGTPMIEPAANGEVLMTFLWRGAARNVRLFGAPSNDHEWLARLGESDVWFKTFRVPASTRLSYQLAPDIPDIPGDARARRAAILATAQMDPLNHHPWPADAADRFDMQATVTLPAAPPQPGTPPAADADPVLEHFDFASATLGNSRSITLSRPRDMDPADPRIVLAFIFDGERAAGDLGVPAILDTLTRQGLLPPVVAVLIPSIDSKTRSRELPGNDAFADALADELLPQVVARTGIRHDASRTVLAGASYGGLAAATVAMRRPDAFGNVLSMSGSFWWAPEGIDTDGTPFVAAELARQDPLPLRFFLSAGSFETGRQGTAGILETSRILRDILRLKAYPVTWREYSGGHDWLVWRGALADGLIAFFGQ
ncbi:MAG: enterochelin esterase [Paracoccaceae bacterium]